MAALDTYLQFILDYAPYFYYIPGTGVDTDAGRGVAAELKRTPDAVKKKCKRLGLEVVGAKSYRTTTSLKLPKELPSVEEALKILAAALEKAAESGLDKVEVQRLQVIATLARTYKEILADYINYREIEKKVKREKSTTVNICRSILALFYGSDLREEDDFHVTTTSRGRRNYHIEVNAHTLNSIHRFV